MKCSVCGKKIPKGASVCPACRSSQGGGFAGDFSGGTDDFGIGSATDSFGAGSGNSFGSGVSMDSFGGSAAAVRQNPKRSPALPLLIIVTLLLAAGALCYVFFFRKEAAPTASMSGFSAPSGHFEQISADRWLLTNELLITGEENMTQLELEKILQETDGVVTGYFPLIHQFQVRFNTGSRTELDQVRAQMSQNERILRIDYNFVMTPFGSEGKVPSGSAQNAASGLKIGLMDAILPDGGENSVRFFLPSHAFETEDQLAQSAGSGSGAAWLSAGHGEAMLKALRQGGEVLFASCCYVEANSDGTLSAYATTASLRYQVGCLAEAGAQVITLPVAFTPSAADEWNDQETDLWNMTLEKLEGINPGFLICKADANAQGELEDSLIRVLRASERGKAHLLVVGDCGSAEQAMQDAAGAGVTALYSPAGVSAGADLCFASKETDAVSAAALCAARVYESRPGAGAEEVKKQLLAGVNAVAANEKGVILPAIAGTPASGRAALHCADLTLLTVTAADSVTGLPISGAKIQAAGVGGTATVTAANGTAVFLVKKGNTKLDASVNGYAAAQTKQINVSKPETACLTLKKNGAVTGAMDGVIKDRGVTAAIRQVTVSIRNTETNQVYPDKQVSLNYSVDLYLGTYDVTFSAYNRTPVTLYGVTITAGNRQQNTELTLSTPSDKPGKAEGVIKDESDGKPLAGVKLAFYAGANASKTGTPVATVTSDSNGKYSVTLPCGTYTAHLSKQDYRDKKIESVYSVGEKTSPNQNGTLRHKLPDGYASIVLTWGEQPADLDSHLLNQSQGIHVYYPADKKVARKNGANVVTLDVDDTTSYGPETTTILVPLTGKYTFYVHDFTNQSRNPCDKMAASGATVTVDLGREGEEPLVFHVPNQPGTLWEVFSYENGVITPVNRMTYHVNAASVGQN